MNIKKNQKITGATETGTTFIMITLDQFLDAMDDESVNIWIRAYVADKGFGVIDFVRNLYGSAVIDDVLYLCKTDLQDIVVNGELVDPESALDNYSIYDLSPYIDVDGSLSPEEIRKEITYYEMNPINWDDYADDIVNMHGFVNAVKAAYDLDDEIV